MERSDIMQIFETAYKRGIEDSLRLLNQYCGFDAKTIPELIAMINKTRMGVSND